MPEVPAVLETPDETSDETPSEVPDAILARRAGLGDREAFGAIVRRHGASMFRYALGMLGGDEHDAEDAVQNAFVQAWQHVSGFRGESALRTWLLRVTANEVRALRRGRRPVPVDNALLTPIPADRSADPAAVASDARLEDDLMAALGELPWRQRACWILAEMEGLTYRQIAVILDVTVPVVRGQLHRARGTLAVRMAQWR